MDFKKLLSTIDSIEDAPRVDFKKLPQTEPVVLSESAEISVLSGQTTIKEAALKEKAVSKAQQQAAGVALSAKRSGKTSKLKGASAAMADMSEKELKKIASTKHKGLTAKKKTEACNKSIKNKQDSDLEESSGKFDELVEKYTKEVKPVAKKVTKKATEKKIEEKATMKKGCKKTVRESVEQPGRLTFKDLIKLVQESGGQQQIDPVDRTLWQWAQRVASSKFTESTRADVYAGLVYERMGGKFEMYDVLSEETDTLEQSNDQQVNED